jgi:hypothetical protein
MKHLLNDLSNSERNRILEQYENSILVETNNFNRLLKAKSGNVKPLINEREGDSILKQHFRQTHSPYSGHEDEFPFPEYPESEEELPSTEYPKSEEMSEENEYLMEIEIDEDFDSDSY